MNKKIEKCILFVVFGTLLFGGLAFPEYWLKATSRSRSRDARIISDMSQLRTVAEILYSSDRDYKNVDCTMGIPEVCADCEDDDIKKLCIDIRNQDSELSIRKGEDNRAYCAYAKLLDYTEPVWYCVDGPEMRAIMTAINPDSPSNCDGTTFLCPKESGELPPSVPQKEKEKDKIFVMGSLIVSGIGGLVVIVLALKKRLKKEVQLQEDVTLVRELGSHKLFYIYTFILMILAFFFTSVLCWFPFPEGVWELLFLGMFLLSLPLLIVFPIPIVLQAWWLVKAKKEQRIGCEEIYIASLLLSPFYVSLFSLFIFGESLRFFLVLGAVALILGISFSLASIIHRGKANKIIGSILLLTFLFPLISILGRLGFSKLF